MSYAEFAAAALDSPVVVDTYVQDHQSWWNGTISVYAQDPEGAYFIYNLGCTEEDAEKLTPGRRILVSGYKGEWAGEIEIVDASFVFLEGDPWVAKPVDITHTWGTEDIIKYQNRLVMFKGVEVKEYSGWADASPGAAVAYKNPEGKTDDLYFQVSKNGITYEFCVEYYLRDDSTEVYKNAENLQVGDTVDLVGFLYWYEGPNLHTIGITVR
jgi:hypothetical protein